MFVNSIRNLNTAYFKGQENAAVQPAETAYKTVQTQQAAENTDTALTKTGQDAALPPQSQADKFQREQALRDLQIPTVAQINKMQSTQKLLGGTVAAVGLLGMCSAFAPKKWVRCLFAIPVGAMITYLGVNMFDSAKSLDKLKDIVSDKNQPFYK